MRIAIAGGTGFIGRSLAQSLAEGGHDVVILARHAAGGARPFETVLWDGESPGPWAGALGGADAVVNLCGESVASRWTPGRKELLTRSRLKPTRAIVAALSSAKRRPRILVNASAVGYYGDRGDEPCLEDAPAGRGFLAELCAAWEAEASHAAALGVRVILLRLGLVLAADGGALPLMALPFWLRVGGRTGSGRQWVPWIARDDVLRAVAFLLENPLEGPVNAAAPLPVTNEVFSRTLAAVLERPCWLPAPAFALRLALGEAAGMLLTGQRAVPGKLAAAGFSFSFPELEPALRSIFPAS